MFSAFINKYRADSIAHLHSELRSFPAEDMESAFGCWYALLEPMRKYICELIYRHRPTWGHFYNCNGHLIDHHIHGYVAPLNFYRIGFSGNMFEPAEQLEYLENKFKARGSRFLYVALPPKMAIYPEIMLPSSLYGHVPSIIPQWRRLVLKLLESGMEVIDAFPHFIDIKKENELEGRNSFAFSVGGAESYGIFSFMHEISVIGADAIAKIMADYIINSSKPLPPTPFLTREEAVLKENGCSWPSSKILFHNPHIAKSPYAGNEIFSEIGIFGDCNLQRHRGTGFDVTSKLSYYLNYPVNYCGRILPFDRNWKGELDNLADGIFVGKKLIIYLGFASACYVRSPAFPGKWACDDLPERFFHMP